MEVLLVLILVSIALAAGSVVACLAAIRGGQYDDLESPRWRILFDDRPASGDSREAAGKSGLPPPEVMVNGKTLSRDVHTSAKAQRSKPL